MSRTGENIYKRKDGRWEGRYIKAYLQDGKAKYSYLYSKTYADIKIKLSNAISESQKQCLQPTAQLLMAEIAEKWLLNSKLVCKLSTYNKYRNTYEKTIRPFLGKYPISKISGECVEQFISYLLTNGKQNNKPYSTKSVQEICMELKQILKYAEENYQVHTQFPLKRLQVKNKPKEILPLNNEEIHTLTRYLIEKGDGYSVGIMLSLYTGIRLGELCAIQNKDISVESSTILINKSVQRIQMLDFNTHKTKLIVSTPKSASSNRIIPIPQSLIPIIRAKMNNSEYYFLSESSSCIDPRTMQKKFKEILAECSIRKVTFHTLRHTFATQCIERGADIKSLSEILGHSSVNITLNRYVHPSFEQKRKVIDLFTLK